MSQFFVEPSVDNPIVLVCVSDDGLHAQALGRSRRTWHSNDKLVHWAHSSDRGLNVTEEEAEGIARSWECELPKQLVL